MKPLILALLLMGSLSVKAQQKITNSTPCYELVKSGRYHTIPTIAFSYIDSSGNLKWQYCEQLVRKAIGYFNWPVDCKTGKKKPIKMMDYWPTYSDLDDYYFNGKIVKPVEIKIKPNYAIGYSGSWNVDSLFETPIK